MAQIIVDRNDSTQWVHRIGVNDDIKFNPYALAILSNSGSNHIWSYNPVNNVSDIEVLCKFMLYTEMGKQGIAYLRYSGANDDTTLHGYNLSFYAIGNVDHLVLQEEQTGAIAYVPYDYKNQGQATYWARMRVVGNSIKGKVWVDGQVEPDWMVQATNTVQTTGSYNGIGTWASGIVFYNYLSFGTNGDSAPMYTYQNRVQQATASVLNLGTLQPIPGIGGGYGSVLGYGSSSYGSAQIAGFTKVYKTIGSSAFIVNKVLKDQNHSASIQNSPLRVQIHNARIQNNFEYNQDSNARIQKDITQIQTQTARIQKDLVKVQSSISRIQKDIERYQDSTAFIRRNGEQSQTHKASIAGSVEVSQTHSARIQQHTEQTITSVARILNDKVFGGIYKPDFIEKDTVIITELNEENNLYKQDFIEKGTF